MTLDRDQRRLAARAEGRRAAGLGPAIVLNAAAGVSALLCGGVFTFMALGAMAGPTSERGGALVVGVLAALYVAIAIGQLIAARRLSRRHMAHRRREVDDAGLRHACAAALAFAALHAVFPVVVGLVGGVLGFRSVGANSASVTQWAILGCYVVPPEVLPLAALLLTVRAWRRLAADADAELLAADGSVQPLDADTVRDRSRARVAARGGTWLLATAVISLAWGTVGALVWWETTAGLALTDRAAGVLLYGLHLLAAGSAGVAGVVLWQMPPTAAAARSAWLGRANAAALAHVGAVPVAVVGVLSLGGWPIATGVALSVFADAVPVAALLGIRRVMRELDRFDAVAVAAPAERARPRRS